MGPTIGEQFLDWSARDPQRTFTTTFEAGQLVTTSYGEAVRWVADIADELRAAGLKRGDRLACFLDDVYQSIYWYVACACTGIAPVPLDPVASTRYLKLLVERAGCKAVFTTA